jgi:GTP-binding protein SAR1
MIWRDYLGTVDGVIFLIDASDSERFEESKRELEGLLEQPELGQVPFVVLGNKVDKKDAVSEEEFREYFGLLSHQTYGKNPKQKNAGVRPVEVFMCSVVKRVGYADGFQWLSQFLN